MPNLSRAAKAPRPAAAKGADRDALAPLLARLGFLGSHELLFHLPLRYEDHTRLTALHALRPAEAALVQGRIVQARPLSGRKPGLWLRLDDGRGVIDVRFFTVHPGQRARWQPGVWLRCHGPVRAGLYGLEMSHPQCRVVRPDEPLPERALAVYPTVAGVSQDRLRRAVTALLAHLSDLGLTETLSPARLRARFSPSVSDKISRGTWAACPPCPRNSRHRSPPGYHALSTLPREALCHFWQAGSLASAS